MRAHLLGILLILASVTTTAQDPPPAAPAADPAPTTPAAAPAPRALVSIQQVQMHVWITETSEKGLTDIGANVNYTRFQDNTSDSLQQITSNVFDPNNPAFTVTLPAPDQTNFLVPLRPDQDGNISNGIQTQAGAGLNFTLIETNHGAYNGVIRALDQSTDVDLISKPELLVISGLEARIHAGGEVPFQTVKFEKGNPQLNIEFKNVGVEMAIKPTVRPDGLVLLEITHLDVKDITRVDKVRGLDLPVISQRSQKGSVLVPNGQALVVGGLTSEISRTSERRVPILGKIPILGAMFRGRSSEFLSSNLMIFVAPTVVDLRTMTAESTNAMRFWQEGSWQNEGGIAEEIALMDTEF
ncbi:MAG: type II and III secretion system protein [Candidatus Hydrogenedentota bacterium]